jgi:hypothetical protein
MSGHGNDTRSARLDELSTNGTVAPDNNLFYTRLERIKVNARPHTDGAMKLDIHAKNGVMQARE